MHFTSFDLRNFDAPSLDMWHPNLCGANTHQPSRRIVSLLAIRKASSVLDT